MLTGFKKQLLIINFEMSINILILPKNLRASKNRFYAFLEGTASLKNRDF